MSVRFAGLGLLSNDVQRLAQFYRDVLGGEIEESNVHCVVTMGEFSFPIYNPHLHSESNPIFREFGQGSFWFEFQVADVDAEYGRIVKLNIADVVPPHDTPFGRRVVFMKDPDENRITLFRPL